jgi:hypothetical protein
MFVRKSLTSDRSGIPLQEHCDHILTVITKRLDAVFHVLRRQGASLLMGTVPDHLSLLQT